LLEAGVAADLYICLFGGLEIRQGDAPITAFISNKAPALLAYLAVTRRPQQRDTLAALLWGEMGDADAKNNLRQALTSLRKTLDPFLEITRDTVALRSDAPLVVDVTAFVQTLRDARQSPAEANVTLLQRAADLYRGDFLEGFLVRDAPEFEEWALAQRTRYRELALQALHTLTTAHLDSADYTAAIDAAGRLLALDGWREEGYRQLMLALARTGQYTAALSQYQQCRSVMRAAFDAEPAEETTALYARIRAALHGPRHNLPAALTGFVGRTAEMTLVRQKLANPACRLLTIVGPGGAGKSRLALEAAAALAPAFLNGVWFASLAAANAGEPEALATTLAAALQIPTGAGELKRQVIGYLRQRELLLVLDNLEHLLNDIGWLSELLAAAPDVKILATSRERLNLQAEQIVHLGGLPTPAADHAEPEKFAAVALFARRARRVEPDFALTPQTAPAVIQICQTVGGLPLGIELAAAWVSHYSCPEIAAAMAANLDFLASTHRDASPRQRSLRAAFDHSWRLLAASEQQAFTRLAVFCGSFTREAAAAVAAVPAATLAALVDKSLVRKDGAERYDLHEVLRHFAVEQWQAQPDAMAAITPRHSQFYLALLAQQTEQFKGRAQKEALSTVGQELENVRAAWHTAVAQRQMALIEAALEALYHFYMLRSWLAEGLEMFRSARLALAADDDRAAQQQVTARLALREAKFLLTLARFEEAQTLLENALATLAASDAPGEVATARYYLGQVCASTGAYAAAEEHVRASLAMRRALNDPWGQAVSLLELGGLDFYRGHYAAAQRHCAEGLHLAEEIGDLQTIAHLLTGLSIVARQLGDMAAAQRYAERGLAVYEELESPYGRIQSLLTLGGLAVAQGDWPSARPYFEQALTASRALGYLSGEADSHYRLGQVATALGESARAADHFRQALRLAAAIQEAPLILDALAAAAILLAEQPSPETASLLAWLLDQPELDAQRRGELAARLARQPAPIRAALNLQEAAGMAIALINRLHI
jgi:predicted ATPase/DNA-binding SARP family transcriptional activator